MKIVWDEPKRLRNITVHGLDFADAAAFEWTDCLIAESYQDAKGKRRFKATGFLFDDLVTVDFSPLGTEAISVISLRRASRWERRMYDTKR